MKSISVVEKPSKPEAPKEPEKYKWCWKYLYEYEIDSDLPVLPQLRDWAKGIMGDEYTEEILETIHCDIGLDHNGLAELEFQLSIVYPNIRYAQELEQYRRERAEYALAMIAYDRDMQLYQNNQEILREEQKKEEKESRRKLYEQLKEEFDV